MFGTIRRHQSWLWVIIITLTIISFVVYFDPTQRTAPSKQAGENEFKLNGKRMTEEMLRGAKREIQLIYFLNTRKWLDQDPEAAKGIDLDQEALVRLFRVAKAEEAGIRISDATLVDSARRFFGEMDLAKFTKEVLEPHGLSMDDMERFIRNEALNQQLAAVVGAAGRLVTSAEAETLYRRDHQEVGGDIVFLHLSNYMSKVVITNGALTNWFGLRMASYRTPEQVRVSYVEFARTNHIQEAEDQFAKITNLVQQLRDVYYKAGAESFKDTNGVVLSETNALARIREDQRDRLCMMIAARKANEFANKLYDEKTQSASNLDKLAASNGHLVKVSMPFSREEGPTNLNVAPRFTTVAFSLNATNNPVSFSPIEGEDGFYVIALKESIPSRQQSYEEVATKVMDDYRRFNAYSLAYSDATNFIGKANLGLASGKTFEEVAKEVGLTAETLPPIAPVTESVTNLEERIDVRQLKQVLLSLEPGKISGYRPNPPDGGYIVYCRAKLPLDEAKLQAELPRFLAELRAQRQNQIYNQWFFKQVEQAKLPLPNRQRRPAQG